MKDLKSELSKNLERLIIGLMLTPAEFDAKMMKKAMEVSPNVFVFFTSDSLPTKFIVVAHGLNLLLHKLKYPCL